MTNEKGCKNGKIKEVIETKAIEDKALNPFFFMSLEEKVLLRGQLGNKTGENLQLWKLKK
jgi:hypothetical protein